MINATIPAASGAESKEHTDLQRKPAASGAEKQLKEWRDLFGTARYTSLRNHCLSLEKVLHHSPSFIPWDEAKTRLLLSNMEEAQCTPSQVQRAWKTIKWLSSKMNLLNPEGLTQLQDKKEAVRNRLVTTLLRPTKRAVVPDLAAIILLEQLTTKPGPAADQLAAAVFRHMAGSSSRYNDISHTQPTTMKSTDTTIEFTAWQTKVTNVLDNTRPMPLIAPKHSFSGVSWWIPLERHMQELIKHPAFADCDYLLPTPTPDRSGLLPRPCSNNQALRWLRQLMVNGRYPADKAGKLTLPSFRVWMADLAYQCGISRDKRRYIGRWANEATADIYTRDHRTVICQIWQEVTANMAAAPGADPTKLQTTAAYGAEEQRTAPEDLSDEHYNLDKPAANGADDSEFPDYQLLPAATGADQKDWQLWERPSPSKRPKTSSRLTPADEVPPDLGGPLTTVHNSKADKFKTRKVHFLNIHWRAIGCGWAPKQTQVCHLDEHELRNNPTEYSCCTFCFRNHTWPGSWNYHPAPDANDGESSDSTESQTDSESGADTASEGEAITLLPLNNSSRPTSGHGTHTDD
jgi:hypothetical protein